MSAQSDIPDKDKILSTLSEIQLPDSNQTVSEAVKSVSETNGVLQILLSEPKERAAQLSLEASVKTAVSKAGFDPKAISVRFAETSSETTGQAQGQAGQGLPPARNLDNIKHIIAVGSGKGGVGKSTATINLAAAMAMKGYKVGILDADIYGPSIGKMAGYEGKADVAVDKSGKLMPLTKHGIKMISFSFLIEQHQSVPWRGPMLGKALEQFLFDISWGDLDYLFIDLPPGTGDVQLSLAQLIELEGAVIVTTPQSVALFDAERAVDMFARVNLPVLGIIENMSEFICPHCGKSSHIFSQDGGKKMAKALDVSLLGSIPLSQKIMESGEKGFPITTVDKNAGDVSDDMKKLIEAYDMVVNNLEKALS